MKMHHPASVPTPEHHDKVRVRWIRDTYDTGYGGHGFGGDKLYAACVVDCFDPPLYVFRADTLTDALEIADECLSTPYDDDEHPVRSWEEAEQHGATTSPSGRTIWADQDIRVWEIRKNR